MTDSTPEDRLASFLAAVEVLPPYTGLTLRGQGPGASFVRPGQSTVTRAPLPTSRRALVALDGAEALYAVWSRTGRSIAAFSAHREEDEVVFLPGTAFYLHESRRIGDVDVRLVFEIELAPEFRLADDLPDTVADAVAQVLEAAQGEPPASGPQAKFVGDIG